MTANGKINASNVTAGDRIIVKLHRNDAGLLRHVTESATKTGEGVMVARVISKTFRAAQGPYERRGKYIIETSVGSFEAAPIQTMWLAPEDAAGIKRARVEAEAEDIAREASKTITAAEEDEMEAVRNADAGTDHLAIKITPSGAAKIAAHLAETTSATNENYTGSTVVRLLEKVWARIREDHPELPEVVIITGSGLLGASKWGHFRADGWKAEEEGAAVRKHELFLAGEAMAKGARQVLQTMLHEGAHTLAQVRGIKDTSRQHRWHNAAFKKLAEEMGLEHKASQADSSHGYSFVTLTTEITERYADLLAELDTEIRLTCHLPLWMGGTAEGDEDKGGEKITGKPTKGEDEGKPKSGPIKAVCECQEPLIIRLSQKVLDLMVVRCDECESLFMAA